MMFNIILSQNIRIEAVESTIPNGMNFRKE